jgi:phosphoribosylglycinamide formyltransferase-1
MDDPPAMITLCISNNPHPGAFDYAGEQGIAAVRLSPKMYDDPERYESDLFDLLKEHGIEIILLAGYMRRIPERVVAHYAGHILNVHPALLPKFGGEGMYGMRVHEEVLRAGETESGASVHLVDNDYDTGPVIAQEPVPVLPNDTPETLAARVLDAEHRLFPRVVIEMARQMADERVKNNVGNGE